MMHPLGLELDGLIKMASHPQQPLCRGLVSFQSALGQGLAGFHFCGQMPWCMLRRWIGAGGLQQRVAPMPSPMASPERVAGCLKPSSPVHWCAHSHMCTSAPILTCVLVRPFLPVLWCAPAAIPIEAFWCLL